MSVAADEVEPPIWSLAEHLSRGAIALARIEKDQRNDNPHGVCHHFWASSNDDDEFEQTVSGQRFAYLINEFSKLGLVFEADRLEAWEIVKPDEEWLEARVPAMFEFAKTSGLSGYQGWTWEPRSGQPIGASEFQVINNRTETADQI